MYKIFRAMLAMIWVMDITNMPFMEFLDTLYPINGLAWLLIWLVIPSTRMIIEHKQMDEE